MLIQPQSHILRKKSIGFTHLFNGLSFDVNNTLDLKRIIETFNSFSVVGIKDCVSGEIPLFVNNGLFGLGYFSYENQIWIDWVILYSMNCKVESLTEEYQHKTLSVVMGYLFKQNSILYVSSITHSYEIIEVNPFIETNTISLSYYTRKAKLIIGALYTPLLLKEIKR